MMPAVLSDDYRYGAVLPFVLLHLALAGAWFAPLSRNLLIVLVVTYGVRMFGVTAGYHRYFSHRSYKLTRGPSSPWRFSPKHPAKRAPCGGPHTTASTTASPTAKPTSIPLGSAASGGRTSVG